MKRILIIGAGMLDKQHAAGITLRSIFDEIDSALLMGVAWGESASNLGHLQMKTRKLSYRMLSISNILDNGLLKKASRSIKCVERPASKKSENAYLRKLRGWIKYLRQWVALLPARSRIKLREDDLADIKEFAPQVIYTVGETVSALDVAYRLSKVFSIPIVIHFMDNWKHSIEWATNPLLKNYQKRLSRYCDLCYSRTTECIAIGDRMAEAYERETGVKHSVVMNSIDTQKFYCAPREQDGVIRFVYAGGLHLGRDKALREIGELIDRATKANGIRAEFSIYTSEENGAFFAEQFAHIKNIQVFPAVPHEQIIEIYKNADVLVHVESDALGVNEFFKYSVSTKISEYLATGRTMLFYGPSDIYLFDFLRSHQLAYTVSNIAEAENVIEQLINGMDNAFSKNASEYANEHFDIVIARKRFEQAIDDAELPKS